MTRMAEVVVRWGEALLDVRHVRPRRALSGAAPLDAPVVVERAGRLCCLSPEGARRSLLARGAYRSPDLMEVVRELDALSGGALVLPDGTSARIEIGALTYEVRPSAPAPETPRSRGSRALPVALLGALALHAPLLLALALAPPRAAALTFDRAPLPVALIASLRELEPEPAKPERTPDVAAPTGQPATFCVTDSSSLGGYRTVPYLDPGWSDPDVLMAQRCLHHVFTPPAREGVSSDCSVTFRISSFRRGAARLAAVRPGRIDVRGGLALESVRHVVRRHLAEVLFCYEQGLDGNPGLQGRVTVQWIIGADGRVTSAAIGSSELHDAPVEACLASAVRRWTFPPSESISGVSYAFTLEAR